MKRLNRSIFILTILLAACANPTTPTVVPAAPAPAESAPFLSSDDVVVASANVTPAQVSDLSYTISALVKEVLVDEGDVVKAGDVLMTLNTPDFEYAVIAAEADFKAKSQAAELQKADKVLYVNPNTGFRRWYPLPREVYLKAKSQADQRYAVLESAQAILAQSTLLAPFDGTVVSVNVIPGELASAEQVVITLATLDKMQITTTDLGERDIARVKIGQNVNVFIEALDVTISGKVLRISPIAQTVGGDVVFPVVIELSEQPEGILWGMSAEVEIKIE